MKKTKTAKRAKSASRKQTTSKPKKKAAKKKVVRRKTVKKKVSRKKVQKKVKKKRTTVAKKKTVKKKKVVKKKVVNKKKKKVVKKKKKAVLKKKPAARAKSSSKKKISPAKKKKSRKTTASSNIVTASLGFEEIFAGIPEDGHGRVSTIETKTDPFVTSALRMNRSTKTATPKKDPNNATLLAIAPHFVFAYWEVSAEAMIEAADRVGSDAQLVLRLYDVTHPTDLETCPRWDVEIFDRMGNWYLKVSDPNQRFMLDIGMSNAVGGFEKLTQAEVMRMPAEMISQSGPLKWLTTKQVQQPAKRGTFGQTVILEEEYTDASPDRLKKILGPYFYDLLMRGRMESIAGTSTEAIFQDISTLSGNETTSPDNTWSST